MKSYSATLAISAFIASILLPLPSMATTPDKKPHLTTTPDRTIFPDDMAIYEHKHYGVTPDANPKVVKNSTAKILPTNNDYKGHPGCYLKCVSKNDEYSIYARDKNEHVKGQMRVKGRYADGHCVPHGYDEKNISNDKILKDLCERNFPKQCVNGSCNVNSTTDNWF